LLTVSAGRLSILKFAFKSFTVAQIIDANPEMPMNEMFSDYTTNHIFPELQLRNCILLHLTPALRCPVLPRTHKKNSSKKSGKDLAW